MLPFGGCKAHTAILQLPLPRESRGPHPPASARAADDRGRLGQHSDPSFRRPLSSARARLETHVPHDIAVACGNLAKSRQGKAAGGRPDHPATRQNDPTLRGLATQNTGKGYCKPSEGETQWGVDVAAQEASNPMRLGMGAQSRKKFAFDGRRSRFHRRQQTFSDVERYEHLCQLTAAARTPADEKAINLEKQLYDSHLTDGQCALIRYELGQVKRAAQVTEYHKSGAFSDRKSGGRDETTGADDVVEYLFQLEKSRAADQDRLERDLAEMRQKAKEKELKVIAALHDRTLSTGAVLQKMSQRAQDRETMPFAHVYSDVSENATDGQEAQKSEGTCETKRLEGDRIVFPHVFSSEHILKGKNTLNEIIQTGRHSKDVIANVTLTELQTKSLETSIIRQADARERSRLAAEEREVEETARLYRIKQAQKDDMFAEELRKERAQERKIERERQTNPKTVPESEHADFYQEVRKRSEILRKMLIDFLGAPTSRSDNHSKPIEEWADSRVRKISQDGQTSTVSAAELAERDHRYFVRLVSVARDSKGCMVLADPLNHCVRRIDQQGNNKVVAGSGDPERGGFADGAAEDALFLCPTGITIDRFDNIYIADFYNNRIRKVCNDGIVTTIAGTGAAGHVDGEGSVAQLDHPESLAMDSHGSLLVADWGNHRIRKISIEVQTSSKFLRHPLSSKRPKKSIRSSISHIRAITSMQARAHRRRQSTSPAVHLSPQEGQQKESDFNSNSVVWHVSTLAGSGESGFKDAMGEAARFNFPHGICLADDGETMFVVDSHMEGPQKPIDEIEEARMKAEAEEERQAQLKKQNDMRECTSFFHDSDFLKIGQGQGRELDVQTLAKLWRMCNHQTGAINTLMERKAASMIKSGMTHDKDISARLRAARKVEVFKQFHFRNVLRMLKSREEQHEHKVTTSESKTSKIDSMFDDAIMTASAIEIDKAKLNHGPKVLRHFRSELTKRFNSVFDAWIYFDMDGDGSMSRQEFVSLCHRLRLPQDLSTSDVFDQINTDRDKEITPIEFVHVLQWHEVPESKREILQQLDNTRDMRQEIFTMAMKRTAEQNEAGDSAAAEKRLQVQLKQPKVKHPVALLVPKHFKGNTRYPHFDPIKLPEEKETPAPVVQTQIERPKHSLPEEIYEMNWNVTIQIDHLKRTGLAKMSAFDLRIDRVSKMLSEKYIKRGRVWRLRDNSDKDLAENWDTYLMVLTEAGKLMLEPDDSTILTTKWAHRLVTDFDMRAIIKHEGLEFKCLGGVGMELVFRFVKDSKRLTRYLFIALSESPGKTYGDQLYDEWWKALRKFSWRADDIGTDHLTTKWTAEEKVLWDGMQHTIKAQFELRLITKVQRWWRCRKKERIEHATAAKEALQSFEHEQRMAYLLRHHGSLGDQGGWSQQHNEFTVSRGLFQHQPTSARTSMATPLHDARYHIQHATQHSTRISTQHPACETVHQHLDSHFAPTSPKSLRDDTPLPVPDAVAAAVAAAAELPEHAYLYARTPVNHSKTPRGLRLRRHLENLDNLGDEHPSQEPPPPLSPVARDKGLPIQFAAGRDRPPAPAGIEEQRHVSMALSVESF